MRRLLFTLTLGLTSLFALGQYCPPSQEITCYYPCTKFKRRPFNCCSMAQITASNATKHPDDYCCQYTCWAEYGCEYEGYLCPLTDEYGEMSYFLRYGPNKLCRQVSGYGNCDGLYP